MIQAYSRRLRVCVHLSTQGYEVARGPASRCRYRCRACSARRLPFCQMIFDVIGDLLADRRQSKQLVLDPNYQFLADAAGLITDTSWPSVMHVRHEGRGHFRFWHNFGHGVMSELSPLSGAKRKLDFGAVRAAFDPTWTHEAAPESMPVPPEWKKK